MSACPESALVEAIQNDHDLELAKLRMQLVLYRQTLITHNILPPDKAGEELLAMWDTCRKTIRAAQECAWNLGTSLELLQDWSR